MEIFKVSIRFNNGLLKMGQILSVSSVIILSLSIIQTFA